MAARNRKASLSELMGADASSGQLSLKHLPTVLGEAMPELPRNAVGRHRLIRALQQRFGPNFRSLPGIKNLISEFDYDVGTEDKVRKIQAIKGRP